MLVNRTRGSLKNPERNIKHYTPEVEPVSTSITEYTIGTIEIISPINHISNQANHLSFNIERWSLNWGSFNDKQSSLCWQLPVEGLIYIYRYTYICLFIACTRIRNDLSAKTMIPLGIRNPQGFMDPNKECVCVCIYMFVCLWASVHLQFIVLVSFEMQFDIDSAGKRFTLHMY